MADRHPIDSLGEIDALLKQEMARTPSAEFLPRVRERVRLEPPLGSWRRVQYFAPLAAAAAIVLAAGLAYWIGADSTSRGASRLPPVSVASREPQPAVPDSAAPSTEHPPSRVARRRASRVPSTEHRVPAVEVIVDERQRAALVSLMRMITDGQLTGDSFRNTTSSPADIGVEPLAVSPIVIGGVLPSEGERK